MIDLIINITLLEIHCFILFKILLPSLRILIMIEQNYPNLDN